MMTPPPAYNFASLPEIVTRDPLLTTPGMAVSVARGEGYLATPRMNRRETLVVETSSGRPEHFVVYPGNTHLPILMAAVTGVFFLAFLLKHYWLAPVALAAVVALALRWVWTLGSRQDVGPEDVGGGLALPSATEVTRAPGWWGSLFLLVADGVIFGSLIFGFAFLFTVAPAWPPPTWYAFSLPELLGGIAGAVLALGGTRLAIGANRGGRPLWPGLGMSGAGHLAVLAALASLLARTPDPSGHAYGATLAVLGGYALFHSALATLMLTYVAARVLRGYVSPRRCAELEIVQLWVAYMSVVAVLTLCAAHLSGAAAWGM
jgi:cytochrome c oxidase subunit I+III